MNKNEGKNITEQPDTSEILEVFDKISELVIEYVPELGVAGSNIIFTEQQSPDTQKPAELEKIEKPTPDA